MISTSLRRSIGFSTMRTEPPPSYWPRNSGLSASQITTTGVEG